MFLERTMTSGFPISGQIAHFSPAFDTGAFFSEGEVLVEWDARDYQIALAQASAEVDSARAQVDRAKHDLERTKIRAPFAGRGGRNSRGGRARHLWRADHGGRVHPAWAC